MVWLRDLYRDPETVAEGTRFLYELIGQRLKEPDTNISHTAMPTWEEHRQFVNDRPFRIWCLIGNNWDGLIGYVSATRRNEIGIVIGQAYRRHGYAEEAILRFMKDWPPGRAINSERPGYYIANINPNNHASIALFSKFNAVHIQNTYKIGLT